MVERYDLDEDEAPVLYYGSVDEFVREFLCPLYPVASTAIEPTARRPSGGTRSGGSTPRRSLASKHYGGPGSTSGAPTVDGTEATYTQADHADFSEVIYEARPDGVKESIVLNQPPTASIEYTFDLALSSGLTPKLRATGAIDIVDTAGGQVFTMPAPFMFDANDIVSTNVDYELASTASGWQLAVTPSDAWLQDPGRVYPVIVDPTVTKTPSTDGWITEANPTTVNGGGAYLRVGGVAGARRRALLKFDLTGIPSDAMIQSTDGTDPALLKLSLDADLTNGDGTAGLVAGRVKSTQTWQPGHLSWNNREYQTPWETAGGAWDTPSPVATVNIDTSGYKSMDVREAVQKWVQGWANNGFIVKQDTNADKTLWFHSVNTATTNPPKLVIKYVGCGVGEGEVDPCAGVDEDDIASDDPAIEEDVALPASFYDGPFTSSYMKDGVEVTYSAQEAAGSTWWDGVCTSGESRYTKVKDYPRDRDHSRMERDYARMYCGKQDRNSEPPESESAFGIRKIRRYHKSQFGRLAAWQGSTWGHWMHWAIWHVLENPDLRTVQNSERFCYEAEFVFRDRSGNTVWRHVVVILGKTGVRIMTSFPRKYTYCQGTSF